MTKQDVLDRLCALATRVGTHLKHEHAHDCFCCWATPYQTFDFSEAVMVFIERAVIDSVDAAKIEHSLDYLASVLAGR